MRILLHEHFILLINQTLKLALLEIANQNLLLLLIIHLAKLPQLILLKDAKSAQIRSPLSSQILHLLVKLSLRSQVIFYVVYPSILVSLTTLADRDEPAHSCSGACSRPTDRYSSGSWLILEVTTASISWAFIEDIREWAADATTGSCKLFASKSLLGEFDLNLFLLCFHFVLLNAEELRFLSLLQMLKDRHSLISA